MFVIMKLHFSRVPLYIVLIGVGLTILTLSWRNSPNQDGITLSRVPEDVPAIDTVPLYPGANNIVSGKLDKNEWERVSYKVDSDFREVGRLYRGILPQKEWIIREERPFDYKLVFLCVWSGNADTSPYPHGKAVCVRA